MEKILVTRQLPDLTPAQEQSRQQFVICVLQLELHHFLVLQLEPQRPIPQRFVVLQPEPQHFETHSISRREVYGAPGPLTQNFSNIRRFLTPEKS